MVEKEDVEAAHSEHLCLTTYLIDSIILCLLEYDVKSEANAELGESADVEAVLGVEISDIMKYQHKVERMV